MYSPFSTNIPKRKSCMNGNMESKHDQVLFQILQEEGNIIYFLDAVLGFLHRRTDFYVDSAPNEKRGLPSNGAERLISQIFNKWKSINLSSRKLSPPDDLIESCEIIPKENANHSEAIKEIEVETSDRVWNTLQSADNYNGAIRDNYTWSQSITDLDVIIRLPSCIKTSKDLKVNITGEDIKVEARTSVLGATGGMKNPTNHSEWTVIFEGVLSFKTKKDESVWTVLPGKHINIHLEKTLERWWDALIIGEIKIELNKIDTSRKLDEMSIEQQRKIQELMWDHQQRVLGKATSEEIKLERMLRKAWDAEGSPFKGTPFDPSIARNTQSHHTALQETFNE